MTERDGDDNVLRVDFRRKPDNRRQKRAESGAQGHGQPGRLPGWMIGVGFVAMVVLVALLRG